MKRSSLVTIGNRLDNAAPVSIDVNALIYSRAIVQANSGGGKSGLLRVIIEQVAARTPTIIIDKEGEYDTLREKIDLVIVGELGELMPDVRSAALLARRLIELHASAVIDLSCYTKATPQQEFVAAFLDALINLPKSLWHPTLIIIDEAQFFFPEKSFGESVAIEAGRNFMALGRKRGFGGILATPRLGAIDKNVANANNYFIGRTALDVDQTRAARSLGMKPMQASKALRELEPRQFFAFGPELNFKDVTLFRVQDCETKIPKAGTIKNLTPPKASSVVKDLAAKLADLPQQAETEIENMRQAKARITDLEKEIKELRAGLEPRPQDVARIRQLETDLEKARATPRVKTKLVDRPVIRKGELTRMEKDLKFVESLAKIFKESPLLGHVTMLETALTKLTQPIEAPVEASPVITPTPGPAEQVIRVPVVMDPHLGNGDAPTLNETQKKILSALIQARDGLMPEAITVLVGVRRSTRDEYLKILARHNYTEKRDGKVFATVAGRQALPNVLPLPQGKELREYWEKNLGRGEWSILKLAIDGYPNELLINELTEEKIGVRRSTRDEYIKILVRKQLLSKPRTGTIKASSYLF